MKFLVLIFSKATLRMQTMVRFLFPVLLFQLFGAFEYPVHAFGGAGPKNHLIITYDALERFSHETGWQVSILCSEIIAQGSVISDNGTNGSNDTLHCDNNDIAGCSYRLDQFKQEANRAISQNDSLLRMGQALHIVQDFYSHSNWVEIFGLSMVQAPLEQFKIVPPPVDLQTGFFPDRFPDQDAQRACFFMPKERWSTYIYGATHACLNKDSNANLRGGSFGINTAGITLHELAAQYAVNHSVQLLKYYSVHNPNFNMCFQRMGSLKGCNKAFMEQVR